MNKVYKKDYFGFVYIWWDKKRNMYYIGSHMGDENDGYICSQNRMRMQYKREKETFKRKVIYYHPTNDRKTLLKEEQRWLEMIKDEDLKNKYYNVCRNATCNGASELISGWVKNHWKNPKKREAHIESQRKSWTLERRKSNSKMIKEKWENGEFDDRVCIQSPEGRARTTKGILQWHKDNPYHSEETKLKMKVSAKKRANTLIHKERFRKVMKECNRPILKGEDCDSYGKTWYNNGFEQKRFLANKVPIGWSKGTLRKGAGNKFAVKGTQHPNYGKNWYNNGLCQKTFFKNEVPDGWNKGTLKEKS